MQSAAVKDLAHRLAEEERQKLMPHNVIIGRLSESEKEELAIGRQNFAPEGRPINAPAPGAKNIITVNLSENERRPLSSGGFDHNPQREAAIDDMLNMEGGHSNRAIDRGGETFRGIARNFWPKWPGWTQIDAIKDGGLTTDKEIDAYFADDEAMDTLVRDFYRTNFWAPFADLPAPNNIAVKVFDTSVNTGQGGAVTILQKAINQMEPPEVLAVDGGLGPKTREALEEVLKTAEDEARFRALFTQEQIGHYQAIVKKHPEQQGNLNGWLRRASWWPE